MSARARTAPRPASHAAALAGALLLVAAAALLVPHAAAHASVVDDALEGISGMLKGMLVDFVNALFTKVFDYIKAINAAGPLGAQWDNLLDGSTAAPGTASSLLRTVQDICEGVVKPVGCGVLSFVVLIQLIRISGRMDANGTLPAVKEILMLAVFIAVFAWLVNNIDVLLGGVYDVLNQITRHILDYDPDFTDDLGSIAFIGADEEGGYSNVGFGDLLAALLAGILAFLVAAIAYIVSVALVYARAIQLYAMAVFAPLPCAFLGIDETRQWGVGFFKVFLSVCLANAILVFVLIAFPFALTSVMGAAGGVNVTIEAGNLGADMFVTLAKVVAVLVVLIIALAKSGSWARDVLGG